MTTEESTKEARKIMSDICKGFRTAAHQHNRFLQMFEEYQKDLKDEESKHAK